MYTSLTWTNILAKNAMICLVWNIYGLSHGHWSGARNKVNGAGGVLEEMENEFWGHISNEGPFEPDGEDSRKWIEYINAKEAVLMEKMSNIRSRLLEVQEKMDSLYEDNNRKELATGMSRGKDTSFGPSSTLGHISLALRQYLQVLRNYAAYLEEVKTSWDGGAPVEEIQKMMDDLGTRGETVDRGELLGISLLVKNLRKSVRARKDDSGTTCNDTDSKIGNVLRQVQKNFSETFLYKNITLAEVNQMSKIVDFVERYRGRVEKVLGPEGGHNKAESGKKEPRHVQAPED